MTNTIQILTVERDGDDGLIVAFSDGTTVGYVAEELLELRPKREWTRKPGITRPESTSAQSNLEPVDSN